MKKLLFLPLALVLTVAAGLIWFYANTQPVSDNKNFGFLTINKGASASQIGTKLEKAGYIKSALAFKIYITFTGQTTKLTPGQFRLTPSFSLLQTINALLKGPVELWVTVPEGLRREEVAAKFAAGLDRNQDFVDEFLLASKGKEGYLFPDTYLFPMEASPGAIVKKMTGTFTSKTNDLAPQGKDLSFAQSVVLASIIERETKTEAERPVVAGILLNRIKNKMPLQVDATVQYALASTKYPVPSTKIDWWPVLLLEDLKIKSAYNTYLNPGLPPTPIASPGLSSLKAAFNPSDSDYFYYIHDPSGQIHYAKTLTEHNANVAKYLH
jgi:UPF0755 protein